MAHDPSTAPGLPEIRDEAADTPMWVPALGLGLFVLATVWMIVTAAFEDITADTAGAIEAPVAVEAPAAE